MKAKRISRLMMKVWEETKNIANKEVRKQQYTLQLLKELGIKPPVIGERLSIPDRGEHLSEACYPF